MYSESEIESAVASGKLTAEAAQALRSHVSELRQTPLADEEQFRLVTSFNDIFVTIAGILVLIGAGWIGGAIGAPVGALFVAGTAWGLSEYFTLKKLMALPSIVFFIAFVGGLYAFCTIWFLHGNDDTSFMWYEIGGSRNFILTQAAAAAIAVGACWLHWRRFMVPIAVAAGVVAVARFVYSAIIWATFPNLGQWTLMMVLLGGLAVFWYAMRWDMADRERKTRKSDVAFWLHLAASGMIVHPLFMLMGINIMDVTAKDDGNGGMLAITVILIYGALTLVALVVDRRAILVSALIYVLGAAVYIASKFGAEGAGFAVAIVVIGGGLLLLSAFWQGMRRKVLPMLPERLRNLMPIPN